MEPAQLQQLIAALQSQNHSNNYSNLLSKPPKFSGEYGNSDVEGWLFKINDYLTATGAPASQWGCILNSFLEGRAANWFRSASANNALQTVTWTDFTKKFIQAMKPINDEEAARDEWRNLRQYKSVQQYITKFEEIKLRIPSANESEAMDRFIAGLKPKIRQEVRVKRPSNLTEAYQIADQYDRSWYMARGHGYDHQYTPNYYIQPDHNASHSGSSNPEPMDIGAREGNSNFKQLSEEDKKKYMKEGRCFKCGMKGHRAADHKKKNFKIFIARHKN